MKKTFLSMLMIASCFGVANAQLIVDEEGKVAVGIETTEALQSKFSINGTGYIDATMSLTTQQPIGFELYRTGNIGPSPVCGMYVNNQAISFESAGIFASSYKGYNQEATALYSYGVLGSAGGSFEGKNFGVAGFLNDTYGTGIFGSSQGGYPNITFNGAYAGFFHGDVYTTGSIYASSVYTPSDYRLKSDIKSVSNSCLDKVLDMNIVEFKYKQRELEPVEAAEKAKSSKRLLQDKDEPATWYEEDKAFMKNKHYGLIAQELQEIYPDLVVEGEDGFLGVNYMEIIPLLIRSIQELNAKVEQYENGNAPIKKAQTRSVGEEATDINAVVTTLYQNEPNPFTESTLIQCDVAEDVVKADLYIYDMNGKQIAVYPVAQRGATEITIEGESLEAGMYLYALITDGKVVDTKRMILTK